MKSGYSIKTVDRWNYEQSQRFALKFNIKTMKQWKKLIKKQKRPYCVPADPDHAFRIKNGKFNATDFFMKKFSLDATIKFMENNNLKTMKQYYDYVNSHPRPRNVPYNPYTAFKDFKNIFNKSDLNFKEDIELLKVDKKYLKNKTKKHFLNFKESKELLKKLIIKNKTEYNEFIKKYPQLNLPLYPESRFRREGLWKGWGDYLNQQNNRNKNWINFEEARAKIRSMDINSRSEYKKMAKNKKLPKNIPTNPQIVYRKVVK